MCGVASVLMLILFVILATLHSLDSTNYPEGSWTRRGVDLVDRLGGGPTYVLLLLGTCLGFTGIREDRGIGKALGWTATVVFTCFLWTWLARMIYECLALFSLLPW